MLKTIVRLRKRLIVGGLFATVIVVLLGRACSPQIQTVGPGTSFDVVVVSRAGMQSAAVVELDRALQRHLGTIEVLQTFAPVGLPASGNERRVLALRCRRCEERVVAFFAMPGRDAQIDCVLGRLTWEAIRAITGCPPPALSG